jgi:hypothetical protein
MNFDINSYLFNKGFLNVMKNPFLSGKSGIKISEHYYMWKYENIKGFVVELYYNSKTRNRSADLILPDKTSYRKLSFKKLKEILDKEMNNY